MKSYNRYSYCFNNPLRFTDPSGYVVRGRNDILNPQYFIWLKSSNSKEWYICSSFIKITSHEEDYEILRCDLL